jgi:hypothetical protein
MTSSLAASAFLPHSERDHEGDDHHHQQEDNQQLVDGQIAPGPRRYSPASPIGAASSSPRVLALYTA